MGPLQTWHRIAGLDFANGITHLVEGHFSVEHVRRGSRRGAGGFVAVELVRGPFVVGGAQRGRESVDLGAVEDESVGRLLERVDHPPKRPERRRAEYFEGLQ